MKKLSLIDAIVFTAALLCACGAPIESKSTNGSRLANAMPQATISPTEEDTTPAKDTTGLCKQLGKLKVFPGRNPSEPRDPIYSAIMAKGKEIMPCLIDEITNETPMHDPRQAPVWEHYKIGDTAVFLLVDIARNDELLTEMLPPAYREEWKTNGVYAYFNYVSESKNRHELQGWWRAWLTKRRIK